MDSHLSPSSISTHPPSLRHGAKALLTRSDRCLLVKELHLDGTPFWTLPGGAITVAETPADGLRRELQEELNASVSLSHKLSTFWYAHQSTHAITRYHVFKAALTDPPSARRAAGIIETQWAPLRDPPSLTLPQVKLLCHQYAEQD